MIANVSISALFLAGVVPGLLLGAVLMGYMVLVARRRNYPREARASGSEVLVGAVRALPALLMPVVIMGGILGGIFTPTEAAGIAVVYAFLVGTFFYRRLKLARLPALLLASGVETAVVMLLLGLSEPFAWVVAVEQIPLRIMETMAQVSTSPWVFLLLVNLAGLNLLAWRTGQALAAQRQAQQVLLTDTFPQVKVVVDAPVQMAREDLDVALGELDPRSHRLERLEVVVDLLARDADPGSEPGGGGRDGQLAQ